MFAEIVCGPPGSGKTTYCEGKRQFLSLYQPERPVVMLNLDPANEDVFPYPCDVDIRELVLHRHVMEDEGLGPNGTYLLCADIILANMDTVMDSIDKALERRIAEVEMEMRVRSASSGAHAGGIAVAPYLLIDCPGQVEFYLGNDVMHALCARLQKTLQCNVCIVHLADASVVTRDIATYVSSCLLSMSLMTHHELPQVNVLTKWDVATEMHSGQGLMGSIGKGGQVASSSAAEHAGTLDLECFLQASSFLAEDFDRLWAKQIKQRREAHQQAMQYPTADYSLKGVNGGVDTSTSHEGTTATNDFDFRTTSQYKYAKSVMEVVDGYGLVGYTPLDVQSEELMRNLTQLIDNAMGNFF